MNTPSDENPNKAGKKFLDSYFSSKNPETWLNARIQQDLPDFGEEALRGQGPRYDIKAKIANGIIQV